jgi:glycosyltransferase involved in cell wall biosynthesis
VRVVLLTSGVRGIGTYCMNLHNELLANGHVVLLVSERKWEKTLPASFYQAKSVVLFGVVPIVYKPAEAMRAILDFKPDLIHYHWPSGEMAYFLRRFEELEVPVLTTVHVSLASRENILDKVWYHYFSRLKKWIPGIDMINCISGFIRDQLSSRMEISQNRVTQIYAGVNEKVFKPIPKVRGAALELLFIGAISPEKGIDVLVKAVEVAGRSRDIRLTIVGSGPLEKKLRHHTRDIPGIRWIACFKYQFSPSVPYR